MSLFIFVLFIDPSVLKRKRHKYGEMGPNTLQQLEDMEKLSKYQPLLCYAGVISWADWSEKIVDKGLLRHWFSVLSDTAFCCHRFRELLTEAEVSFSY